MSDSTTTQLVAALERFDQAERAFEKRPSPPAFDEIVASGRDVGRWIDATPDATEPFVVLDVEDSRPWRWARVVAEVAGDALAEQRRQHATAKDTRARRAAGRRIATASQWAAAAEKRATRLASVGTSTEHDERQNDGGRRFTSALAKRKNQ